MPRHCRERRTNLDSKDRCRAWKRYYARRKQERMLENIEELKQYVAEMSGAGADVGALRAVNMKLVGSYLLQALSEGPERLKELTPTINLMLQNDHNEALRGVEGQGR